jgi:DNA-binding NtrC family response regulator
MSDLEILFVDDDPAILNLVEEYLNTIGYSVTVVDNGLKALKLIRDADFDVVFTDFKMPDIDGLELLAAIKEFRPSTEVIIVTGHGSMESAINAMKWGSYDYLQKPFKLEVLKIILDRIAEDKKLKMENIRLKSRVKERHKYDALIGISLRMQAIYETIERIRDNSPNVILWGESGTGKELTAHVIHRRSDRSDRPFVPVICKALAKRGNAEDPAALISELVLSADGGALFFDEITELSDSMQAEVARQAVSSEAAVRLLISTSKDLNGASAKDRINAELLRRANDVQIQMPPLRERKEDICLLVNHLIFKYNDRGDKKIWNLTPEALDYLLTYDWPGNLIQLENVIERAFALGSGVLIQVEDLPAEIKTAGEISSIRNRPR